MKVVRSLALALILSPAYFPLTPRPADPMALLRSARTGGGWDPSAAEDALCRLLSRQGKDSRAYFAWRGNGDFLHFAGTEPFHSGNKHFTVVSLMQWGFSIPGEWIERYLLLDSEGRFLDVATVVWPTRLLDRFRSVPPAPPVPGGFREITDLECKEYWGNFNPPLAVLGLEPPRDRRYLGWNASPQLGTLCIENGFFRLQLPK